VLAIASDTVGTMTAGSPVQGSAPTAAQIQASLQTIPALSGNGNEVQQLTLVANGATTLSFNNVNAATALTVATGTTTAANVLTSLNSITGQSGNFSVTGNVGGPFQIQFIGALAGQNVSQLVSSATAQATVATLADAAGDEVQTLTLAANGTTTLSYNGVSATSALTITPEVQTLNLLTNGTTTLAFNGVNATLALTVTTGASGTLATAVQTNLQTIPVLSGNEVQTLTLVANGTTILSFNGGNATSLTVTTGSTGTTAAQVKTSLQAIPPLTSAGHVTVNGS